jgi:3-phenylpropionate/cinnamic acid dioxygenase small subunit
MTNIDHAALADELAIRSIVARLAHLADYGDVDEYLGLYAEGAVWQRPSHQEHFKGAEELRAIVLKRRRELVQGPDVDSAHCNTTLWVELRGDGTATAHSYYIFICDGRTTPTVRSTGRYEDEFVKTDAGWKLASRTVHDHIRTP